MTSFHFSLPPPHSLISKIGFSENRALPRIRELDYNVPSAGIWKVLLCKAKHRLYAPVRRKTNVIILIRQAFHYDGGCPLSTCSAHSRILTIRLLPPKLSLAKPCGCSVDFPVCTRARRGALPQGRNTVNGSLCADSYVFRYLFHRGCQAISFGNRMFHILRMFPNSFYSLTQVIGLQSKDDKLENANQRENRREISNFFVICRFLCSLFGILCGFFLSLWGWDFLDKKRRFLGASLILCGGIFGAAGFSLVWLTRRWGL